MSRAFVKEPDGDDVADDGPELPQSPHPNYITPRGLEQLRDALAALHEQRAALPEAPEDMADKLAIASLGRQTRYLEGRIARAIVTDPSHQPSDRVCFGATVETADENGETLTVEIVGEDEAAADRGRVSWVSPLAKALLGGRVGDVVTWDRPAGKLELEILSIRYAKTK